MDRLLRKTKATGSADRKYSSGRKHRAHTRENIDAVEETVTDSG